MHSWLPKGFVMFWLILLALCSYVIVGWVCIPIALVFFGARFVRRRLLGQGGAPGVQRRLGNPRSGELVPSGARTGCPPKEKETLRQLEKRLVAAHDRCLVALNTRLQSELARARVTPPLEEAYTQIKEEIESIYAFCARNDLVGTLKKANTTMTAKDIYLDAYQRDLNKVHAAIAKTEECLAAYERTVATLEVSSVEADIASDFDASIAMLEDLRNELPRYNLEDRL